LPITVTVTVPIAAVPVPSMFVPSLSSVRVTVPDWAPAVPVLTPATMSPPSVGRRRVERSTRSP